MLALFQIPSATKELKNFRNVCAFAVFPSIVGDTSVANIVAQASERQPNDRQIDANQDLWTLLLVKLGITSRPSISAPAVVAVSSNAVTRNIVVRNFVTKVHVGHAEMLFLMNSVAIVDEQFCSLHCPVVPSPRHVGSRVRGLRIVAIRRCHTPAMVIMRIAPNARI